MSTLIHANAVVEAAVSGNANDLRATLKGLFDAHAAKQIAECDCQLADDNVDAPVADDDGLEAGEDEDARKKRLNALYRATNEATRYDNMGHTAKTIKVDTTDGVDGKVFVGDAKKYHVGAKFTGKSFGGGQPEVELTGKIKDLVTFLVHSGYADDEDDALDTYIGSLD